MGVLLFFSPNQLLDIMILKFSVHNLHAFIGLTLYFDETEIVEKIKIMVIL